jgi:transposase, IS30 family
MYTQITPDERYRIAEMLRHRLSISAIAVELGRSPSTISREIRRNRRNDGGYRAQTAVERTNGRRRRSRRGSRFREEDWDLVEHLIRLDWSPEQISGWLSLEGHLSISHETIYLYVWADKKAGGDLWQHLRQRSKKRRKRYRSHDSRGRLAGKRHISERPPEVETREKAGHFEVDTIKGDSQGTHTVITLVERKTGYLIMGKLERHTAADCTARLIEMIRREGGRVKTITSDNGSEFHGYKDVETATGVAFYFATPHHSWERGTNENTNGLIRQYLPKRTSMAGVTQADCDTIATHLNHRPRKRLGYLTPEACYVQAK